DASRRTQHRRPVGVADDPARVAARLPREWNLQQPADAGVEIPDQAARISELTVRPCGRRGATLRRPTVAATSRADPGFRRYRPADHPAGGRRRPACPPAGRRDAAATAEPAAAAPCAPSPPPAA